MNLKESLEAATHRDVVDAMDLQEHEQYKTEDRLWEALMDYFGWNAYHADEIASRVWVGLYAEKDGNTQ